ncbi:hypothetical protein predicted by Glimmer/Critica [Ruminococcus bicirculans (ex Wegman et al. 2014)]|uniref:Uncharacterized protein n=1 Tax=Ruminococcus bicirculans (ex Wegman et al. 2014) TaxID=1160721 RepID=A0ABM9QHG7_9FIRM|nr:hypothetical protein predicted by Glimmer/Critica [Ruminococcus bicirculans (ex Wegman et al. 2014)]
MGRTICENLQKIFITQSRGVNCELMCISVIAAYA